MTVMTNPTALVGELDLDELEAELNGWLTAYPLAAFPEPDLTMAAMLLKAGGMTLDSISASNMRHVANRIAPKALALIATLKAQREALEPFAAVAMNLHVPSSHGKRWDLDDDDVVDLTVDRPNGAAFGWAERLEVKDFRRARASIEGNPTA